MNGNLLTYMSHTDTAQQRYRLCRHCDTSMHK